MRTILSSTHFIDQRRADSIMARSLAPQTGRIHLSRPNHPRRRFCLQSCGGPYILPYPRRLRRRADIYLSRCATLTISLVRKIGQSNETWAIRYLVVATKNWWPGKKVLISPKWIESVSWDAREVVIEMTRETIKDAPEYTDKSLLTRDYETGLHGYYNREGYWVEELSAV